MSFTPYQIVVPLLALVAIVYAWSLFSRNKKTVWEVLLWTLFWGSIGFVAVYPGLLSYLALITGIKNQESAFLVTAIGILFFIVFYVIIRLEDISHQQTRIIRSLALRDAGLEKKDPARSPE